MDIKALEQMQAWEVGEINASQSRITETIIERLSNLGLTAPGTDHRTGYMTGLHLAPGAKRRKYDDLQMRLEENQVYLSVRGDFLFTLIFDDLLRDRYIDRLIDQRISWYRDALARINESDDSDQFSNAYLIQGFDRAVYKAAPDYLEANKHVLIAESLRTEKDVA